MVITPEVKKKAITLIRIDEKTVKRVPGIIISELGPCKKPENETATIKLNKELTQQKESCMYV